MLFFSEKTQGYYDTDFAKYQLPDDVKELTKGEYQKLRSATDKGRRVTLVEGAFVIEEPEVSRQQLSSAESMWVMGELERAGFELDKVQDSDPKAVGTVSSWRAYRKSLRAWSDDSNFPNKEFRPVSPDA